MLIGRAGKDIVRVMAPTDAFALFQPLLCSARRERSWAAMLDDAGTVLSLVPVARGGTAETLLPVARLLRDVVLRGASGLIVAHNHPGGDPTPSRTDIDTTRRLYEAASVIGIRLVDHVVVARGGGCLSFRLMGLL